MCVFTHTGLLVEAVGCVVSGPEAPPVVHHDGRQLVARAARAPRASGGRCAGAGAAEVAHVQHSREGHVRADLPAVVASAPSEKEIHPHMKKNDFFQREIQLKKRSETFLGNWGNKSAAHLNRLRWSRSTRGSWSTMNRFSASVRIGAAAAARRSEVRKTRRESHSKMSSVVRVVSRNMSETRLHPVHTDETRDAINLDFCVDSNGLSPAHTYTHTCTHTHTHTHTHKHTQKRM